MIYDKSYFEKVDLTLLDEYYQAIRALNDEWEPDRFPIQEFKEAHPLEFGFYSSIARKRKKVESMISTMESVEMPMWFGTLTFNNRKIKNKHKCRRQEAFKYLNVMFRYWFAVEEYGELNGRYHIHFVGVFNDDKKKKDFIEGWHSRRHIEEVITVNGVCRYLIKYATKQLPRLHSNRAMSSLDKIEKKCRRARKSQYYDKNTNHHEIERNRVLQLIEDGLI